MKRYKFHSALPPERVFARLSVRAKQGKYLGGWQEPGQFLYYKEGDRLWLSHTGKFPVNGFVPFSGTVRAEGTGSVITGGFFVLRAMWRPMTIMGGLAFVCGLLIGVPPLALLASIAVWLLLSAGSFAVDQPLFFRKRRKAVLKFIQENLLE